MGIRNRKLLGLVVFVVIVVAAAVIGLNLYLGSLIRTQAYSASTATPAGVSPIQGTFGASTTGQQALNLETAQRMIIYTATLNLGVEDAEKALSSIQTIATEAGGFVSSMTVSGLNRTTATITLRIPEDKFFETIAKVEKLGTLKDKRVESQDVTERYIDLEARLKNSQAVEQRLSSLLEKATTLSEILTVERELKTIRQEIESLRGQINY